MCVSYAPIKGDKEEKTDGFLPNIEPNLFPYFIWSCYIKHFRTI